LQGESVAVLSSANSSQPITISTSGAGIINIVGMFHVHRWDTDLNTTTSNEPIFKVDNLGKVRILTPNTDGLAGAVEISGNSTGAFHPPNQSGVIIHTTGHDRLITRKYMDANNNYPLFVGRRYNGTVGSLTQVLNGEIIFRIAGQASTGADFEDFGSGAISWIATEDQSTGNQGGKINIRITPNGSAAAATNTIAAEFTETGILAPLGVTGDLTGNADTVTNGVYTTGNQSIAGNKSFSGNTNLGAVAAITITGGAPGQYLTTDGAGSLSWTLPTANTTYYEADTVTGADFTPNPMALVDGMTLTAIAGVYRVESNIQYTVKPAVVSSKLGSDLTALIAEIEGQPSAIAHADSYGAGETITAGFYTVTGATTHGGNIIFDAEGDPNATFIFKCGAGHALSVGATTSLVNGAKACNIFWYVVGALSIGASCNIQGTYIGSGAIAPGIPFSLEGRLFTKTGALTMGEATFAVPVGSTSLTLGLLEEFAFFTPAGTISNTIIPGGIGDINSGNGLITGFSEIEGNVYLATGTISEVEFELYQNGSRIASSFFSSKTQIFSRSQHAVIVGTATVGAGEDIELFGRVIVGTMTANNRSIFAIKLN